MSKIEWTEDTWNPIAGCSIVSPGCTNCYAMKMAHRLAAMGVPHYQGLTRVVNGNIVWTGKLAVAPDSILLKPLSWKAPRRIFVNSMSDLFHEDVPDEWIDRVFAVMALCPQHTFQVLTKRSARLLKYVDGNCPLYSRHTRNEIELAAERMRPNTVGPFAPKYSFQWPLPNVWLGVSAEDQRRADERIPDLLATPAAVRFVSAEPLLGGIDFTRIKWLREPFSGTVDTLRGVLSPSAGLDSLGVEPVIGPRLDWIIVGGESGHGARPMQADWARSIVRQCKAAGISVFVKQLGAAYSDEKNGIAGAALVVPSEAAGLISRRLKNRKGGDMAEWPADLCVREMPRRSTDAVAA